MKPGDMFVWLHLESDNRFGERCQIVAIRGDKVDFKYVNRPNWREATMPLAWVVPKRHYSPEEISEIRKKQKRRRFAEKF